MVTAGAVAGLVSRFCISPLDVIKIRLQLQVHSLSDPLSYHGYSGPVYSGFFGTLRSILHDEGITVSSPGTMRSDKRNTDSQRRCGKGISRQSFSMSPMALPSSRSTEAHPTPSASSPRTSGFQTLRSRS